MKQTAVDWLVNSLSELEHTKHLYKLIDYRIKKQKLIDQAKQMEKEQRKDAYVLGRKGGTIKDFNQAFKSDNGCACYGSNSMHKCNCK